MKLKLSETLSLPVEAVTQTFADLGIRGSGKTNTGVVLAEEMLKAGQQICALDPTDAWYGIRSSRDGKSEGFKVYVFGGEHGDLPLTGAAGEGATMAEFLVESGASVVFSLRHLSISEQRRFATEFGERLYELKGKGANRTPLHIFVDEADEFIPQRIPHGHERMFGAYDRLVRRGRSSGVGLTMISQRPQVLNKDTLSQCEILICHRLLHKLDRKAVREGWVEGHDINNKADEFMQSLASLDKGEAWFWSPSWLDVFKRIQVRWRDTFDSSFTPKAGERPKTVTRLAEVDLDALKAKLSATIEKVKADDPKELKKEIQRLLGQLRDRPLKQLPPIETQVLVADAQAIKDALLARDEQWVKDVSFFKEAIRIRVNGAFESSLFTLPKFPQISPMLASVDKHFKHTPPRQVVANTQKLIQVSDGNLRLRAGAERMLSALVQWYPARIAEGRLRAHAGMKKSGTYSTYKSDMITGGYAELNGEGLVATQAGIDYFGGSVPSAPSTTEDVVATWNSKLRDGARRMLNVLVAYRGEAISKDQLFSEANLTASGTTSTYLSDLRTAQLVTTTKDTVAANKETLFL